MKQIISLFVVSAFLLSTFSACAQNDNDKSKRPSPPASVSQTLSSGAHISINYSQPSLKGRTMGKDVEPMQGKVWRAGANEATVFETDKDIMIEGKTLPAGKYAFFTIDNGSDWTLIFNKKWNVWGAFDYDKNKGEDALQVHVKPMKASDSVEKLTYTISKDGMVTLAWGTLRVPFHVK